MTSPLPLISLLLFAALLMQIAHTKPRSESVAIDAAPSIVSYQGSSARTHGKLVIAPMGRSLGYVEPTNLNRTVHVNRMQSEYDALGISPVYVGQ